MHSHLLRLTLPVLLIGSAYAGDKTPTSVPSANPKVAGYSAPNILSPELAEVLLVQGSVKLENPSALTNSYGYDANGPFIPAPGDLPLQHVDAAEPRSRLVDRPGHRGLVPHVQLEAGRARQARGDRGRPLGGPAGQRDRRSRRGQSGGHRQAQAARPAGHQHLQRRSSHDRNCPCHPPGPAA